MCFCGSVAGSWAPFSGFSRKWESAFRLRRRERIEVQATNFPALCLHFLAFFFASFFSVFWTCLGARFEEVRGGGGTPLNEFN